MSRFGSEEFYFEIAKGAIDGHRATLLFGVNDDVGTAGYETVWDGGGDYLPPTEERIHSISSADAADVGTTVSAGTATGGTTTSLIDSVATFQADGVATGDLVLNDTMDLISRVISVVSQTQLETSKWIAPNNLADGDPPTAGDDYRVARDASTGASVVHITGLGIGFIPQQEFVVLNGTTVVATSKAWLRQHRLRALATASLGVAGSITALADVDGTVTSQIINGTANNNQSQMAVFSVPFGFVGFITQWNGSVAKKQTAVVDFKLRGGFLNGMKYLTHFRTISTNASSSFDHVFPVPPTIPGGADVWIEALSDTNSTSVSGGFDIIAVRSDLVGVGATDV